MDHMAVINNVAAPLVSISPAARQGQQMGGSEVKVEPVIMQPDAQAVADQAGRHGVEYVTARQGLNLFEEKTLA
jgi:hypothetical protein